MKNKGLAYERVQVFTESLETAAVSIVQRHLGDRGVAELRKMWDERTESIRRDFTPREMYGTAFANLLVKWEAAYNLVRDQLGEEILDSAHRSNGKLTPNLLSKVQTHLKEAIADRRPRFVFYRFLHILDRRAKLPEEVFLGEMYLNDEMLLQKSLTTLRDLVFIDVGAKEGLWTLKLARRCREVHAFEPNPATFLLLKRNTRKHKNLHLHQCALGAKKVFGNLLIHERSGFNSLVLKRPDHTGTIQVPIRTLDSFNFECVNLVKIDTEGYEIPVLRGAEETIERCKPQLYIEVHLFEDIRQIAKLLRKYDYTYSIYLLRNTLQPIMITAS